MGLLPTIIMNVALLVLFFIYGKNMSFKLIEKKMLRAVVISVIFSSLGILNIYLIDIDFSVWEMVVLITLNLTVIIGSVGIYKKNWKLAIIAFFAVFLNLVFDNNIDKNSVMPIVILITYIRSILYLELFWDGVIGIYVYYKKVNAENVNMLNE
jgi:hypothetical protein